MSVLRTNPLSVILVLLVLSQAKCGYVDAQKSSSFHWTFDGDIRYRYEKWDNMNALSYGSKPSIGKSVDQILLQRFIVGTTLGFKRNIKFSAHMQDSRAFGWSLTHAKEPDAFKKSLPGNPEIFYRMNPQEEFFELYDLNLEIDSFLNIFKFVAGRQKIAVEDYRVFGPGSWGNTGRWTWDAVSVSFKKNKWSGMTWYGGTKIHDPQITSLPFTNTEYFGGGMHVRYMQDGFWSSDIYLAHKHQGSTEYMQNRKINRNWGGFRIHNPMNTAIKYEISYTQEFGKENEARLNGYGFFGMLGYQVKQLAWNPCLSFRYTYASGDNPETGLVELFDPVYGAGDRYYGWMNLFKWSNLDDREIMLELYPSKGLRAELKYNSFRLPQPAEALVNGSIKLPEEKNHLGDEIDLFTTYDVNKNWQLVSALGYFWTKEGQTFDSEYPGNAFLISFQVLYRFNMKLS